MALAGTQTSGICVTAIHLRVSQFDEEQHGESGVPEALPSRHIAQSDEVLRLALLDILTTKCHGYTISGKSAEGQDVSLRV